MAVVFSPIFIDHRAKTIHYLKCHWGEWLSECQVHTRCTTLMVELRLCWGWRRMLCVWRLWLLYLSTLHRWGLWTIVRKTSNTLTFSTLLSLWRFQRSVSVCVKVCVWVLSTEISWLKYSLVQKAHSVDTVTKGFWFNSNLECEWVTSLLYTIVLIYLF